MIRGSILWLTRQARFCPLSIYRSWSSQASDLLSRLPPCNWGPVVIFSFPLPPLPRPPANCRERSEQLFTIESISWPREWEKLGISQPFNQELCSHLGNNLFSLLLFLLIIVYFFSLATVNVFFPAILKTCVSCCNINFLSFQCLNPLLVYSCDIESTK